MNAEMLLMSLRRHSVLHKRTGSNCAKPVGRKLILLMKIQILGHRKAGELARSQPGLHDFVFITYGSEPWGTTGSRSIIENCREHIRRDFDDIELPRENGQLPSRKDVQAVLDWVEKRKTWMEEDDVLTVSCSAGVSRSAGMAIVIASTVMDTDAAIELLLDEKIHWPNEAVVGHGADILDNQDMLAQVRKWKKEAVPEWMEDEETGEFK